MYTVLIAPDSFKGTLTANEVCEITGKGFKEEKEDCKIIKMPLADGGEGLCACMAEIFGGEKVEAEASGVFGERIKAEYLVLPDSTAVIETASVAGLPMAGDRKNPMLATTYGLGELILNASQRGAKRILLGLGGSATNDLGAGMAAALGYEFYGESGKIECPTGKDLSKITSISAPKSLPDVPVICACDVDNPLYGQNGAAYVFAPQKGADENMVKELDLGLRSAAEVIKTCLGKEIANVPGAGAAGGLGAGASAFLNAQLKKGIDIVLDFAGFDEKAKEADLIITGEGRLDSQSVNGKVISGVAKRASALGKKVITICGCSGEGWERAKELGISDCFFSCPEPKPFDEVLKTCREDLLAAAKSAAKKA